MDIILTVLFCLAVVCISGVSIITTNPDPLLQDQPGSVICSGGRPFSMNKDGEGIVTCGNRCGFNPTSTYYQQIPFAVTSNTNSVTVNIPTISRQRDSGPWICTVFNSGNMESTTKNINITDIKVPVQSVSITTNGLVFQVGSVTSVTCSTVGTPYPSATITWYIGSRSLGTTNPLQYEPMKSDNNQILNCSASNGYGGSKSDTHRLNIKYSVSRVDIINITRITLNPGDTTLVTCQVDGNPVPTIIWSIINGRQLSTITGQTTDIYQYTATKLDNGKYLQCSASNGIDVAQTDSVVLNIGARPDPPHQLRIQSQSDNQICVEWKHGFNGGATQTFTVQHSTDDITWVDSSPIPDRNDSQLIQYCITDLEPESQYFIILTASNNFGESQVLYFKNYSKTVKTTGNKVTSGESEEYSKGRASCLASCSSSGIGIGIGIGVGISVGLMLLVLASFLIYRRLAIGKQKKSSVNENYSTLNPGTQSGEPQTYQELNYVRTYEVVGTDNTGRADSTYINT